ncbi:MAG: CBS domain-containing protein [Actinobacteria bacterium]|nr:CBS domain-containing protein [Actinomycetota bacterium]
MHEQVRQVMTPDPICLDPGKSISDAARQMRENDIGAVVVADDGHVTGIVTDRDIVVRALAQGRDPESTRLKEICTTSPVVIAPDESLEPAVELVRGESIRRIPVVDGDRPVGILSLGDLAEELDSHSALGEISSAPANN